MHAVYFGTGVRVANLAAGAALGLALRTPGALRWLQRRCGGCRLMRRRCRAVCGLCCVALTSCPVWLWCVSAGTNRLCSGGVGSGSWGLCFQPSAPCKAAAGPAAHPPLSPCAAFPPGPTPPHLAPPPMRPLLAAAALAVQAAFLSSYLAWCPLDAPSGAPRWDPLAARLFAALAYWGGPLVSAGLAVCLLALLLRADPLHAALAGLLGCRLLEPFARLSYCLYLVHELARILALTHLLPLGILPSLSAPSPLGALLHLCASPWRSRCPAPRPCTGSWRSGSSMLAAFPSHFWQGAPWLLVRND
ncbi:hypothetical protein ABPG75_003480 [Micractinium tetrahymenae]